MRAASQGRADPTGEDAGQYGAHLGDSAPIQVRQALIELGKGGGTRVLLGGQVVPEPAGSLLEVRLWDRGTRGASSVGPGLPLR